MWKNRWVGENHVLWVQIFHLEFKARTFRGSDARHLLCRLLVNGLFCWRQAGNTAVSLKKRGGGLIYRRQVLDAAVNINETEQAFISRVQQGPLEVVRLHVCSPCALDIEWRSFLHSTRNLRRHTRHTINQHQASARSGECFRFSALRVT